MSNLVHRHGLFHPIWEWRTSVTQSLVWTLILQAHMRRGGNIARRPNGLFIRTQNGFGSQQQHSWSNLKQWSCWHCSKSVFTGVSSGVCACVCVCVWVWFTHVGWIWTRMWVGAMVWSDAVSMLLWNQVIYMEAFGQQHCKMFHCKI